MAAAAPELPEIGIALADVALWVAWAGLIALLWIYRRSLKHLITGFASLLDFSVPVVGGHPLHFASVWLNKQAQNIDSLIGEGITACERGAVVMFHLFINLQLWIAREIADLATATLHAIQTVHTTVVKPAVKVLDAKTQATVRKLTTSVAGIEHLTIPKLRHLIDSLTAKVAHLAHAIPANIATTLPRLGRIEKEATNLEKWIKKHGWIAAYTSATALFVAALTKLKLGWIRCPNMGKFGRFMCGFNTLLMDTLLAALTLVVATEGIVPFAKQVQGIVGDFAPLVGKFWHANAIGQGGDRNLGDSTLH